MHRKPDGLVPKPNHECNLCDYTFSIKEVSARHMNKEHNGAAPVQKLCNMCLFTSHLSHSDDLGDREWLRTDFGLVWYTSI